MARAETRAWAQRAVGKAVLQGTRAHRMLLLRLAQTAAKERASTVRVGGTRSGTAAACGGHPSGTGIGERRTAAHRLRGGRRDLAHGVGRVARMIHLPASVRVYLCLTACDMRKSFDGLQALVREHLELDAFAGPLFVFASRRRD